MQKVKWEFSGNALAVHTFYTNTFVVDYKILDLVETEPMMQETMEEPAGTLVPGCKETNECCIPENLAINAGDTAEWVDIDTAAHTVTSGSPAYDLFGSRLVMGSTSYSFTFEAGTYDYCMVHPWMAGSVTAN